MKKAGILALLLWAGIIPMAQATDLMDIYLQALDNDTFFKQSYDKYMSSTEAIPQARAALFPQLNVNTFTTRNVTAVKLDGISNEATYNTNTWQVTATQALFNFQAW